MSLVQFQFRLFSLLIETTKKKAVFVDFKSDSEYTQVSWKLFFVVVSSHMTYDGLISPVNPDL